MTLDRRELLTRSIAALGTLAAAQACARRVADPAETADRARREVEPEWQDVVASFDVDPDKIHMSALLISSHPAPVREAIRRYREEIDRDPVASLQKNNSRRQEEVIAAAADYLGAKHDSIALTESTTMGLGLVYNGIPLGPGDEVLTTRHDYYATHESLRLATEGTGARVREIALYETVAPITREQIVSAIAAGITPATRAVALTWVHSGTGLKLPIHTIGEIVARANASRPEARQILLCVDGVHGFGVEDVTAADLNCDFFMAGVHKWMFGPRGTGIIWGSDRGMQSVRETIPSFMSDGTWQAWISGGEPPSNMTGRRMSPGGFKAFEHQWAMKQAFEFHQKIGKTRIRQRTHSLATQLKEGLASIPAVTVVTPASPELSSGIVCFDVDGMGPDAVVSRLDEKQIVATVTPYATPHVRLTPSIMNTPAEIEMVLAAVRELS
jgi:isopenicillin-N epimerase